jgi:tetratricopeptide (TPR) repeat protein
MRKSTSRTNPKGLRKFIFWLVLASLPIVFFTLLELGLRAFGFGHSYPLFIQDPNQPGFNVVNPDVIKRYFPKPEMAPPVKIESTYFTRDKRPNALRIVVQGESTTAGYPYGLGASLAGILQQRLQNQYPDRYVEVIQTAMSAVNSYTLLDFSDEILAIKPDVIVIYAGHNEYLGVMGVGSAYASHNRATTLLMLKLKDLRIYQALQQLYIAMKTNPEAMTQGGNRTLMAQVAREKNIAFGSPLYQQGLDQFEGNMSMLLMRYRKSGIPVYLGTIASNLRDQKPFNSLNDDAELQSILDQIGMQISAENNALTAESVQPLIASISDKLGQKQHALAAYRLGQLFDINGDYSRAKDWYLKARDWDQLRFRAPSAMNDTIKKLSANSGVYLVDSEVQLTQKSPKNIIGKELMLEHLHPNIEGYFWLSESYFQQLLLHLGLPQKTTIDPIIARQQVPVLPAEYYMAQVSIERLLADYPYSNPARAVRQVPINNWHDQLGQDMIDHKITWLQMVEQTRQGYIKENNIMGVANAAALLAEANPKGDQINFYAGTVLIQARRYGEAIRLLQRAIDNSARNVNAHLALAHARILTGNFAEGERLLDQVLVWEPGNPTAISVKQQISEHRQKAH